jgi:hypothetical protein
VRRKLKDDDAKMVFRCCLAERVPKAEKKRHIRLFVTTNKRGRRNDPANLQKSCHDALVKAGALVDDSSQWLSYDQPVVQFGPEIITVIEISEAEGVA